MRDPAVMKPKSVQYKHSVDEATIDASTGKPVGKKETLQMIGRTMDEMPNSDPARKVYDKVWKGVRQI